MNPLILSGVVVLVVVAYQAGRASGVSRRREPLVLRQAERIAERVGL